MSDLSPRLCLSSHFNYFTQYLKQLPRQFESLDANRITLIHFCLIGTKLTKEDKDIPLEREAAIDAIYQLQSPTGGFVSSWTSKPLCPSDLPHSVANIAMTYSAISSLRLLGDDLSRIDRSGLKSHIQALQLPNGCISCSVGSESDMRFVYCACVVCDVISCWECLDQNLLSSYIMTCLNIDGGFGATPYGESHAGSTFCAIASLFLMNKLDLITSVKRRILRFLHGLQTQGLHGRLAKADDSCYTYWVGATVAILDPDSLHLFKQSNLIDFISTCTHQVSQSPRAVAVAKNPESLPDPMHASLGLAGLLVVTGKVSGWEDVLLSR
ncbi:hypothetical protein P9112_008637 [Eukaryota sp. TZLM1-RC]